jgi:type I restriction enzyme S subunit
MSAQAAVVGLIRPGEVLVARSNTAALVGRVALYSGHPANLTATDLIFRLVADESRLDAEYLARFLAGLQLVGYWRNRSSGASSTMSKITRAQLMSVPIPLPPVIEQQSIAREFGKLIAAASQMAEAIASEVEAIEALPAALLRQAFIHD